MAWIHKADFDGKDISYIYFDGEGRFRLCIYFIQFLMEMIFCSIICGVFMICANLDDEDSSLLSDFSCNMQYLMNTFAVELYVWILFFLDGYNFMYNQL